MTDFIASIVWRRLDTPGHDACRLQGGEAGWQIEGTAVFRHEGAAAMLTYLVVYDATWHAREGRVKGWLGGRSVDLRIVREPNGVWSANGVSAAGLESPIDLDFGFTPATNTAQLRRLGLKQGASADAPVAWLDVPGGTLRLLSQRYERLSETTYRYEAPEFGYEGVLETTGPGFVRYYPGLWEEEP